VAEDTEIEQIDIDSLEDELEQEPKLTLDTLNQQAEDHTNRLKKKKGIIDEADKGVYRRGVLSSVLLEAKENGFTKQARDIMNYASEFIEEWKVDGDLDSLNENLTKIAGKKIRAALELEIKEGFTVQMYLIGKIKEGVEL
jgi:hypothetical protein